MEFLSGGGIFSSQAEVRNIAAKAERRQSEGGAKVQRRSSEGRAKAERRQSEGRAKVERRRLGKVRNRMVEAIVKMTKYVVRSHGRVKRLQGGKR